MQTEVSGEQSWILTLWAMASLGNDLPQGAKDSYGILSQTPQCLPHKQDELQPH